MIKTIKSTDQEYKTILNRRNPFQLLKSDEVRKRVEFSKKQHNNLNVNRELGCRPKPNSVLFDNISNGRFFN